MAPKKNQTAQPKESAAAKRQKFVEEATKAKEAADRKNLQSTLHSLGSKPTATEGQKAALQEYKAAPKGSAEREEILKKFMADKKCTWWQECLRESSDVRSDARKGIRGHGTRFVYLYIWFLF